MLHRLMLGLLVSCCVAIAPAVAGDAGNDAAAATGNVTISSHTTSNTNPPVLDASGSPLLLDHAQAARSDWNAAAPPAAGWIPVSLMDYWETRWPDHDGVVWYRLRWHQRDANQATGLLVRYMSMTGAIHLNGSAIARDPSLVEPLSRGWTQPRYFLIAPPLLRQGDNELMVRVSGLSAYQPGFGTVSVGDAQAVQTQYRQERFRRYDVKLINLAMTAVLGGVFALIWLLRRGDTIYGWFALTELAGSLYSINFIAFDPWPFSSTDGWSAFNAAMYLLAGGSYVMFLLRYGERRYPRLERAIGVVCALGLASALLLPHWMGPNRTPWIVVGGLFFYLSIGWFLLRAWRVRRIDYTVMAACLIVPMLVSLYDFALYFGWVRGDTYLLGLTSVLTLIGVGFLVAYRFVAAMRRMEGFNQELEREVQAATTRLSDTLSRQHTLELAHGRAGERLQLVRDLHDGFGGTLVGAIAELERAPQDTPKDEVVGVLKQMRDDLRLVIDSTAREHADLAAQIAPLRHRMSRLLETAGIDAHWRLSDIDGIELGTARSLDLLRLLQEALTNVFKHSRAAQVDIAIARDDDRLRLHIRDDGRGMTEPPLDTGAGLASMRLRARRLGGELRIDSSVAGTGLSLELPLAL